MSLCECTRKFVGNVGVTNRVRDRSSVVRINKASGETVYTFPKEKLGRRIKGET